MRDGGVREDVREEVREERGRREGEEGEERDTVQQENNHAAGQADEQ